MTNITKSIFRDTGEGDEDFYTFWYSICYVLGFLNVYRRLFRDITDNEMILRRFLDSRTIAYKNESSIDELSYLYEHYVQEIEARGTHLVNNVCGQTNEIGVATPMTFGSINAMLIYNQGMGVLSNSKDLKGTLSDSINLGTYNIIEFDCVLLDEDHVQYEISGLSGLSGLLIGTDNGIYFTGMGTIDGNGFAYYVIKYVSDGNEYEFTVHLNVNIANRFKFLRYSTKLVLFINDTYTDYATLTTDEDYIVDNLFTIKLPALANIRLVKRDLSADLSFENEEIYEWICCEGAGFVLESNRSPDYSAILDISYDEVWENVWRRSSLFDNTNVKGIDGEVRRLLNYSVGECLLELISTGEMGMCIDISSFLSEEANCLNLNKAYQKGEIAKLSHFPLHFNGTVKPYLDGGFIVYDISSFDDIWYGLNVDTFGSHYKPTAQKPFIPINVALYGDSIDGYEISFVIQSNAHIALQFGVKLYDQHYTLCNDAVKKYSDDSLTDLFLDESDFSLCENRELWIRGVYSLTKLTGVQSTLNINKGDNLYNVANNAVFIAPLISFKSADSSDNVIVKIKDIVVRPLTLNTSKGLICHKNTVIGFLKNESGRANIEIQRFIDDKTLPYNCLSNIQYL